MKKKQGGASGRRCDPARGVSGPSTVRSSTRPGRTRAKNSAAQRRVSGQSSASSTVPACRLAVVVVVVAAVAFASAAVDGTDSGCSG